MIEENIQCRGNGSVCPFHAPQTSPFVVLDDGPQETSPAISTTIALASPIKASVPAKRAASGQSGYGPNCRSRSGADAAGSPRFFFAEAPGSQATAAVRHRPPPRATIARNFVSVASARFNPGPHRHHLVHAAGGATRAGRISEREGRGTIAAVNSGSCDVRWMRISLAGLLGLTHRAVERAEITPASSSGVPGKSAPRLVGARDARRGPERTASTWPIHPR